MSVRGYSAIGLYSPTKPANVGGVLRAAGCYGASVVVIQGKRYTRQATDTQAAYRHIPLIHADLLDSIPFDCVPVAIEICESARPLPTYQHPERAFYIFGPEDSSVPKHIMARCRDVVYVPTTHCMNLAATVNVVLYDRTAKRGLVTRRAVA